MQLRMPVSWNSFIAPRYKFKKNAAEYFSSGSGLAQMCRPKVIDVN